MRAHQPTLRDTFLPITIAGLLSGVVLAIALLAGGAAHAAAPASKPSTFELPNGLRVVVVPDHRAPIVTHMVFYKIGSADERPEEAGLAHYLEHMMFMGTPSIAKGEFDRFVGGVGAAAILNVYTWRSQYASAVGGVGARLQWAEKTRFTGLITAATYSRIQSCQVEAGITVTSAVPDIQPSGMIDTVFAGVFTGPAASARMDGNTNFWFKANGAVLAGGATKVIQDDLVP